MHGKLISMAFACTALACVTMAQSPAPDWRMYGITPTEDRVALFTCTTRSCAHRPVTYRCG